MENNFLTVERFFPQLAAAPSLGSIPNPPGGAGWSWGRCGCHRDPPVRPNSNSAVSRALMVLNYSHWVMLGSGLA